jgi:hypothetical protein
LQDFSSIKLLISLLFEDEIRKIKQNLGLKIEEPVPALSISS